MNARIEKPAAKSTNSEREWQGIEKESVVSEEEQVLVEHIDRKAMNWRQRIADKWDRRQNRDKSDYERALEEPRKAYQRANTEAIVTGSKLGQLEELYRTATDNYADAKTLVAELRASGEDEARLREAIAQADMLKREWDAAAKNRDETQVLATKQALEAQRLKEPINAIMQKELAPLDARIVGTEKKVEHVRTELKQLGEHLVHKRESLADAQQSLSELEKMPRRSMTDEQIEQYATVRARLRGIVRGNQKEVENLEKRIRKGDAFLRDFHNTVESVKARRNNAIRIATGDASLEARAAEPLKSVQYPTSGIRTVEQVLETDFTSPPSAETIASAPKTAGIAESIVKSFLDIYNAIMNGEKRQTASDFVTMWNEKYRLTGEKALTLADIKLFDGDGNPLRSLSEEPGQELTMKAFSDILSENYRLVPAFRAKFDAVRPGGGLGSEDVISELTSYWTRRMNPPQSTTL